MSPEVSIPPYNALAGGMADPLQIGVLVEMEKKTTIRLDVDDSAYAYTLSAVSCFWFRHNFNRSSKQRENRY